MKENKFVRYNSHLPLLIRMIGITTGDVLELGTGLFSTPVVHWMCSPDKRNAVSYESEKKYYEIAKQYENDYHKIKFVENWDSIDIEKPWDVAFIDHEAHRRRPEALRLANYAKFVILHDTCGHDEKHYHYKEVYPHYKYIYQFLIRPRTAVMSNFVDVNNIGLWK